MSLEEALNRNTEATLEQTGLLKQLLGAATIGGTVSTTTTDSGPAAEGSAAVRKRGEPSPGKQRRTAAEVAEDKAADEADGTTTASTAASTSASAGVVTFDGLKGKLGAWLGEFAKEADRDNPDGAHPEVIARKSAVKAVLNKLTGSEDGKLGDIAKDAEKIGKLNDWYENKAKNVDKGFGIGRLAADPAEEDAGEEEADELDI